MAARCLHLIPLTPTCEAESTFSQSPEIVPSRETAISYALELDYFPRPNSKWNLIPTVSQLLCEHERAMTILNRGEVV